nr:hypothetical protein Iba_chr09bCG13050 [Ipomoea batatas]
MPNRIVPLEGLQCSRKLHLHSRNPHLPCTCTTSQCTSFQQLWQLQDRWHCLLLPHTSKDQHSKCPLLADRWPDRASYEEPHLLQISGSFLLVRVLTSMKLWQRPPSHSKCCIQQL